MYVSAAFLQFVTMRAGGEIGVNFLLAKISGYNYGTSIE